MLVDGGVGCIVYCLTDRINSYMNMLYDFGEIWGRLATSLSTIIII